MPPVREKMRPWLVRQINSNSISGLSWVDQEKTMFCIPWKHAARHGWDMDKDACIFQKWAIHTGKYVVGQQCSPKTWKANFRCALNSLPDVVEVKGRSIQKGHEAMRVFQLLPESHKPRGRRAIPCKTKSKRKIKIESDSDEEEFSRFEFQQSSPSQNSTQESTVDSTVDDTLDNTVTSQQSDMKIEMDVPDWSQTVEVGAERYDFQVSPERSPDSTAYVFNSLTVMICSSSGEEKAFPVNDLSPSPGSHWSEASSGEELEELSLCTTLSPSPPGPEMWSTSLPQTLFAYPDETPLL